MIRLFIIIFSIISFSNIALANPTLVDEINQCESVAGAGGCIFDILRKLANNKATSDLPSGSFQDERGVLVTMSLVTGGVDMQWPSSGDLANGLYNCEQRSEQITCKHFERDYELHVFSAEKFNWYVPSEPRTHYFNKVVRKLSNAQVGGK